MHQENLELFQKVSIIQQQNDDLCKKRLFFLYIFLLPLSKRISQAYGTRDANALNGNVSTPYYFTISREVNAPIHLQLHNFETPATVSNSR